MGTGQTGTFVLFRVISRKILASEINYLSSGINPSTFGFVMANKEPTSKIPATQWLWLFVLTYVIHIAEEFWGGEGYSAHLLKNRGVYMSPTRFLVAQAIGTALMAAGVLIANRLKFPNAMAVIFGAAVLGNAIYLSEFVTRADVRTRPDLSNNNLDTSWPVLNLIFPKPRSEQKALLDINCHWSRDKLRDRHYHFEQRETLIAQNKTGALSNSSGLSSCPG